MRRLTGAGEIVGETEQRLIRWGCSEGQAHALSGVVKLHRDSSDHECEQAACLALVMAKQATDGATEVEYIGGIRRDTLRLEGR